MAEVNAETEAPVYRSRWDVCDECECVTIVERDDNRGVPDDDEWDWMPSCPVCGGSLTMGNADETTVSNTYWARGKRAGHAEAVRALTAKIEAAYPVETFPREWVLGEDRRSGTVRTVLDMLRDFGERTCPPASTDKEAGR